MRVIFIGSLPHSGSTLLDLMLNAHPDVTSVGELKQLVRFAGGPKRDRRCTCGAPQIWDCPFWRGVNDFTQNATSQKLTDLNVEHYGDVGSFQADNTLLFKAIAATSGTQYIVDSSKSWKRLRLLLGNPDLDVLPVFLLRNPKGQVSSGLRKGHGDLGALIRSYVRTNLRLRTTIGIHPHVTVKYERLVRQPVETLTSLMKAIGLDFRPEQLDWSAYERHNVGGNGMRRHQGSKLELDESWREGLTLPQRIAVDIGTLPGRYPLLRLSSRLVTDRTSEEPRP